MSTDEARKEATRRTEVSGRRARAALGNRFPEVSPGRYGYRYLLVLVDTFSGWVETAMVVAKKILEEIVPRFGLPVTIGSDNGPAFVSQIVQSLARALGTKWKLHCEYSPQSSGQVERMNRTLKETFN